MFPKHGRRAVVLCDGPSPPYAVLSHWLAEADAFICTDAAGRPYETLPRLPGLVIGDFDTLRREGMTGLPEGGSAEIDGVEFMHVADQESTDSEKALLWALTHFHAEAVLLGATGGRIDHSAFNVSLLERFADRMALCIADEFSVNIRLAPGSMGHWDLPVGTGFSLIPLAGPVHEVTVSGAAYPLHDAHLIQGGPATVSNRVEKPPLSVRVGKGSLLLSVSLLRPRDLPRT